MRKPSDDRSPLALGMVWTSRVTTVSLEMVLPCVVGYWIDRHVLDTQVVFTLLGAVFGLVGGMWHLIRMAQPPAAERQQQQQEKSSEREQKS